MARVIRSPLARRDVIAAEPQRGKVRGTRPGILSYHIKQPGREARHILFYRASAASALEIVRFLHDSMDFDQHLQDLP